MKFAFLSLYNPKLNPNSYSMLVYRQILLSILLLKFTSKINANVILPVAFTINYTIKVYS